MTTPKMQFVCENKFRTFLKQRPAIIRQERIQLLKQLCMIRRFEKMIDLDESISQISRNP